MHPEATLTDALALAGALSRADLVSLRTGVTFLQWGALDLEVRLPSVTSQVTVNDTTHDPRFCDHPLVLAHQMRSLLALPITHPTDGSTSGILWLLSRQPGAFASAPWLEQVSTVMAGLLKTPPPAQQQPKFAGVRVLVAEDNLVNQRLIQGLLSRLGCTVYVVDNGAHALDALAEQDVDLVLMDCQMPQLDGFETTRLLRARETAGHLPIVALTASVMSGDRERCLAAGMDDFLTKPMRLQDLERMLESWGKTRRPAA